MGKTLGVGLADGSPSVPEVLDYSGQCPILFLAFPLPITL